VTASSDDQLKGALALDITHTVADPIRGLRDRLGLLVDHLERHVSTSTGPTPYPWRSLQSLRQDLAAAYLEATQLARRIDELDRAVSDRVTTSFDLSAAVEQGLRLASHQLSAQFEQLFDLGTCPPVRGVAGTAAVVIAQLVGVCARSARNSTGSALSVRVWTDEGTPALLIADNGAGDPGAEEAGALARPIVEPWGATVDVASAPGQGCAFELRFAI
jgi:signal transduction histidine kinase